MKLYNKTIIVPNLNALNNLLINNENSSLYNCKCIYGNRIAIQHYFHKNKHYIRIWKTIALFDYWYNDYNYCHKNFIASLEYTIYDNYIKIDYLYINNYENKTNHYLYNNPLNEYESEDLIISLLNFIKIIAKKQNKYKIIKDVHENLQIYYKYYYYNNFNLTERRCKDNPFWIETEVIL